MTMFVFAALTVAAAMGAITVPPTPEDLATDEISHLIALGFVS